MNRKYFDMPMKALRTTPFGIFVDQAGYCPESRKKAVIPFECDTFDVTDINGNVRYSGNTIPTGSDEASGDNIWLADFSGFSETGNYCIKAGDRTSAMFCIGGDVYDDVFNKTSKQYASL